jgi:hypothetical protein
MRRYACIFLKPNIILTYAQHAQSRPVCVCSLLSFRKEHLPWLRICAMRARWTCSYFYKGAKAFFKWIIIQKLYPILKILSSQKRRWSRGVPLEQLWLRIQSPFFLCTLKGIDRSFELRGESRLIWSVMTNWRLGIFFYFILNGHHHKISKKPLDAA